MRRISALSCFIWAALAGTGVALGLVLLFRVSQSAVVYRFFTSIDRLAFITATAVTSAVFPGDSVVRKGVGIATFFDAVLVVVSGLQCGVLGAIYVALRHWRRSSAVAMRIDGPRAKL